MRFFFLFLLSFSHVSFAMIPDLIEAPISEPFVEKPKVEKINTVEKKIRYLEDQDNLSDRYQYELALLYLEAGDEASAKKTLEHLLSKNPQFFQADVQLGFIYLWGHHIEEAYRYFCLAIKIHSRDPKALFGLEQVALEWAKSKKTEYRAMILLKELIAISPNDPDYRIYLANIYIRQKRWELAEKELKAILQIHPKNPDAILSLANLYLWEGKLDEARKLYEEHPDLKERQIGFAKLAGQKGDQKTAICLYRKALEGDVKKFEERWALARAFTSERSYQEAKKEYKTLLHQYPYDQKLLSENFAVKTHTNLGGIVEASYTDAKENDPTLREPVVKDYYFYSALKFEIPALDCLQIEAKGMYFHQRENNILNPSVNYSAFVSGGQLSSYFYFAKDWKWNVILREIRGWGAQNNVVYPFVGTNRFEPGTALIYNSDEHIFAADAHVESFVIKNFANGTSQLLRESLASLSYDYRPDVFMHPQMGVSALEIFYQDHNREDIQFVRGQVDLGTSMLTLTSLFEHSHFKNLTPNYFSYNQQLKETLGLKFHTDPSFHLYFETLWEHSWQWTHNLIMPIGNFLFIAQQQYIIGNLFQSKLIYRYSDKFKMEIGGHYLRTTLVYRDWNLQGALHYIF